MNEPAHDVLWRRLSYALTPQWDFYYSLRGRFVGQFVLEVGFGTGAGVLQYQETTSMVDAIEVDPGAVEFAKRMFPLERVNWRQGDITTFDNGIQYGSIVMIETLEHIESYRDALNNIRHLLVPGGKLIMSARNRNTDLRRHKDQHYREWTANELHVALSEFFDRVELYDYTLENQQARDTRITPLYAVCMK